MKKKLVGLFVAAAMILALPNVAFAATFNSPSGTTVTDSSSGVALSVSAEGLDTSGGGYIQVVSTDEVASNVPTGVTPLANFKVSAVGEVTFDALTLTFSVGTGYAGATATVYIQNDDGTTEERVATVANNGTVTITVSSLVICSIVVDGSTSGASVTVDTSSTSPATDANLLPVLCMTVAATAGAGVSAVSLRKRLSR